MIAQALEILATVTAQVPAVVDMLKQLTDYSMDFDQAQAIQDQAQEMIEDAGCDIDFLLLVECLCCLELQEALGV